MDFNWRDYATLDRPSLPPREKVHLSDRAYAAMKEEFTERNIQYDLLEKTLDQMSLLPEFQQRMKDTLALAPARRAELNDMYPGEYPPLDDNRTTITLNADVDGASYSANNILSISADTLAEITYHSEAGPQAMSLQRAILHEYGHGADETLTPSSSLKKNKDATQAAVDQFLNDFPHFREEYESKGTLGGLPITPLLEAKNSDEFRAAKNTLLDGSSIYIPETKNVLEGTADYLSRLQYTRGDALERELVSTYLENAIDREDQKLSQQHFELPVIASTNPIMSAAYGEPDRIGYLSDYREDRNPYIRYDPEYQKEVTSRFKETIHPAIKPETSLSPTELCPQELLDQLACSGITINTGNKAEDGILPPDASPLDIHLIRSTER